MTTSRITSRTPTRSNVWRGAVLLLACLSAGTQANAVGARSKMACLSDYRAYCQRHFKSDEVDGARSWHRQHLARPHTPRVALATQHILQEVGVTGVFLLRGGLRDRAVDVGNAVNLSSAASAAIRSCSSALMPAPP